MKSNTFGRRLRSAASARTLFSLIVGIGCLANWNVAAEPMGDPAISTHHAWREGARLSDVDGEFRTLDARYIFIPSGESLQLTVLENLNLERVARMLEETPQANSWRVSGTITEFQGRRYLSLDRAVRKFRASATADA